jgi:hypothetical protein
MVAKTQIPFQPFDYVMCCTMSFFFYESLFNIPTHKKGCY